MGLAREQAEPLGGLRCSLTSKIEGEENDMISSIFNGDVLGSQFSGFRIWIH